MLYQAMEWQRAFWAPVRIAMGSARSFVAEIPGSEETALTRLLSAGFEMVERFTRTYERPRFDLDQTIIDGTVVAVHEETAWQDAFCTVTHFVRDVARDDPRLLIVAPLSGHFATLLRGTVEALLPEHDVYITEWTNARDVPIALGDFDLDDYIDHIMQWLRALGPDLHVLAVCQPVVPVLAAVALLAADGDAAQPRSMTLMAGPVDARQAPTKVNEFATTHSLDWFKHYMVTDVPFGYAGAGRRVYPGFVQLSGFMAMNPDRHAGSHARFFADLALGDIASADHHRDFYDEYLAVMDLPAPYYIQTVDRVFQSYSLAKGEFVSRDRHVDPGAIRHTALLTVEGGRDDISGLGQTSAAHDLCTGLPQELRDHHLQEDVGHFGVFSGRSWREETMPRVRDFIRRHRGSGNER
jgi:poly(3-hydroxybutyrate) depolymerase